MPLNCRFGRRDIFNEGDYRASSSFPGLPLFPWTKIIPRSRIVPEGEVPSRPDSGFVVEINDRFLLRKLPSRNLTSIYLIAVVLLQARHCSVKSHPFPFLSLPPSVRAYVLLSLLPSFLPSLLHSHHPIFSARTRICAARRGAATFIGQAGTILSFARAQYEH